MWCRACGLSSAMPEPIKTIAAFPALVEAREAYDDGNYDRAARLVMEHLRRKPGDPAGLAMLGSIALAMGAFAQAEKFFRASLAGGADQYDVRRELARCVAQQDRLEEALALHEELRLEKPDDHQILTSLAWINDKLGRLGEASRIYTELTEKFPKFPAGWLGLGVSLRAEARTDEAVSAFRRAIEADPTFGQAWWEMANIKAEVFTDQDIEALRAALDQTVRFDDQAFQHFALGRALHQRRS